MPPYGVFTMVKYLKKVDDDYLYVPTDDLRKRGDMIEVDIEDTFVMDDDDVSKHSKKPKRGKHITDDKGDELEIIHG